MALVTNTQRALTDRALNSIGRQYFSVTVALTRWRKANQHPMLYLRAAALLDCRRRCWPSRTR